MFLDICVGWGLVSGICLVSLYPGGDMEGYKTGLDSNGGKSVHSPLYSCTLPGAVKFNTWIDMLIFWKFQIIQ